MLYLAAGGTAQSGVLNTEGFEIEANHVLPGNFEVLANYGYSKLKSETSTSLDYMPRHTASLWSAKTFNLSSDANLRIGGGVIHSGKSISTSAIWSIVTPSRTTVDALAELTWKQPRGAQCHQPVQQQVLRVMLGTRRLLCWCTAQCDGDCGRAILSASGRSTSQSGARWRALACQ